MNTTPITTDPKAKNQGFLLLGVSALCLVALVPLLLIGAHVASDAGTRRIVLMSAFAPALIGIALAVLAKRMIAGKTKPF